MGGQKRHRTRQEYNDLSNPIRLVANSNKTWQTQGIKRAEFQCMWMVRYLSRDLDDRFTNELNLNIMTSIGRGH